MHPVRKTARVLGAIYLVVLAASHVVRHSRGEAPRFDPADSFAQVPAVGADRTSGPPIRLAYERACPAGDPHAPVVLLLHGSPGGKRDFAAVVPDLSKRYCVIAPDLPGFGDSERRIPDYSIRAHARYALELMDALGVGDAHVVGFSMGGGVALSLADLAPERVRSITMLSAIGVQEMELLGDGTLNHAVHGAQLTALWALRELTPHFGWLDDALLGVPYARNFYDSDQRPLRAILARWPGPMLIVHGKHDPLVPIQAAREHARIVPQSEIVVTDTSHFMVFVDGPKIARTLLKFLEKVDRGEATVRTGADPARVRASLAPFDPRTLPPISGLPWLLVLLLIALATLVSEDLTCIGAGLLVATGRIGYLPATAACFLGIFVGDLNAFFAGRVFGRAVVVRRPVKWMVTESQLQRASAWFRERGPAVILSSRFLPGTRVATFVAAGVLHTSFVTFAWWLALAALLWTPLLVGVSAILGAPILDVFRRFQLWAVPGAIATAVLVLLVLRVLPKLFSWRGRRLLLSAWIRMARWEYWPPVVFYAPVAVYLLWLGLRHRGLTLFTAANPGIDAGGFVNESKAAILEGLAAAGDAVPPWRLLPASAAVPSRLDAVRRFIAEHGLTLPIVLKPDAGQRGSGVVVARSLGVIDDYLSRARYDVLVQAYVPGDEFGVFYARRPSDDHGQVFAITVKRLPVVVGDGRRTLDELILRDPRAVAMAPIYRAAQEARLNEVVRDGESVQLVDLGTHCRGAYFSEGIELNTPALEAEIDRISRVFPGFYFGRFDVRSPSVDDFRRGVLRVIELNGVTSEATSIYDRSRTLLEAYRTLFAQWRLAFAIGRENRDRGHPSVGPIELARLVGRYRATSAGHV